MNVQLDEYVIALVVVCAYKVSENRGDVNAGEGGFMLLVPMYFRPYMTYPETTLTGTWAHFRVRLR